MKKKITDSLLYVSAIIVMIAGVWGIVYEYIILDKSVVPDLVFSVFFISGYAGLIYIIIWIFFNSRRKKRK